MALVIGEAEAASGAVSVKPLRGGGEQRTLEWDALTAYLRELIAP